MITLKVLKVGQLTTGLTTVLFTVPAGETWRILRLSVVTGTASAITLSVNDVSAVAEAKLLDAYSIAANSFLEFGDIVLEAGDQLKGGGTVAADYTVFGTVST